MSTLVDMARYPNLIQRNGIYYFDRPRRSSRSMYWSSCALKYA